MFFAFRNLALPAILLLGTVARADSEAEWSNPSERSFKIKFVKFDKVAGKLTFKDASGVVASWDRTTADGASIPWPAGKTFKVTYSGTTSSNANFLVWVVDESGSWVEFLVNNPTVGAPTLTMKRAYSGLDEGEGTGFQAAGLKGGLKLNRKGSWTIKHDGTSF